MLSSILIDKIVVVSGTFTTFSRDELKELIEKMVVKMQVLFQLKQVTFWLGKIWGLQN